MQADDPCPACCEGYLESQGAGYLLRCIACAERFEPDDDLTEAELNMIARALSVDQLIVNFGSTDWAICKELTERNLLRSCRTPDPGQRCFELTNAGAVEYLRLRPPKTKTP